MSESKFKEYSTSHIHFIDQRISSLLLEAIYLVKKEKPNFSIVDVGCGDGAVLYSLFNKKILGINNFVLGLDLSEDRLNVLRKNITQIKTLCADACHTEEIEDASFDLVLNLQVIEHVLDDKELIKNLERILKPKGVLYITTVIKRWYGFYFYRNKGKIVLDPTHVKEYKSKNEFLDLFKNTNFKIIKVKIKPISFPITDLFLRFLIKLRFITPSCKIRKYYLGYRWLVVLRNVFRLPVVGYYSIEVITEKE